VGSEVAMEAMEVKLEELQILFLTFYKCLNIFQANFCIF
jgi:hypothetical protein